VHSVHHLTLPGYTSSLEASPQPPRDGQLSACTPARTTGRPVTAVPVDDDLLWVVPVPTALPGAARRTSPAALVHLHLQLAQQLVAAGCDAEVAALCDADLIHAAARAVAGYLDDLPELPLVGEPFGGEEGTD
jgi:hypothetical protein